MMAAFETWISSGQVMTLVLGYIAVEIVVLWFLNWRTGKGIPLNRLLSLVAPGLCIFMALRASLLDASPQTIALWMLLSFAAHLYDVRMRWRESKQLQKDRS